MWHLKCLTCVARPLPHLHPEAVHAGQVRGGGALGEVSVVHGDLGIVVWLVVIITETKSHN